MDAHDQFRVNRPTVLHESFDGEVIAINQTTGVYYSIEHAGAVVWDLLESGCAVAEVIDLVKRRYDGDHHDIESTIRRFVAELHSEELIVPGHGHHHPHHEQGESATVREPFQAPVLNKFSDMTDMLLLDPIHEVEDAGWPVAKHAAE